MLWTYAIRLRESGMLVVGIGEKKTPNPFIVACDKFIYIEIIGVVETKPLASSVASHTATPALTTVQVEIIDDELIKLLKGIIEDLADDNGWAFLAEVGGLLMKKRPDFDARNYGFFKLTPLIKSLNTHFEVEEKDVENKHIKHIYVKNKE